MKHCEVCGKQIKTGYKYCFEHRNFREKPQDRWERKTLEEAKDYHKWIIEKKQDKSLKYVFFIFTFITFGIPAYIVTKSIIWSILIGIVFGLYIIFTAFKKINRRARQYAQKQIDEKDDEFINNAKEYIALKKDDEKEEIKLKKSLFKKNSS